MDDADSQTLVLLTNWVPGPILRGGCPSESALASRPAGALTVATTHINELKIFAHQQEEWRMPPWNLIRRPSLPPIVSCRGARPE